MNYIIENLRSNTKFEDNIGRNIKRIKLEYGIRSWIIVAAAKYQWWNIEI